MDRAKPLFFEYGLAYLVAARAMTQAHTASPVIGNLYHHAIEVLFKGVLYEKTSEEERRKLGHSLTKIWTRFRVEFPDPGFDRFDITIRDLDPFEEIRYPEAVAAKGLSMIIGAERTSAKLKVLGVEPRHIIATDELDELARKLFAVGSVNPDFFLPSFKAAGRDMLKQENRFW
jgi:hypothetical protein